MNQQYDDRHWVPNRSSRFMEKLLEGAGASAFSSPPSLQQQRLQRQPNLRSLGASDLVIGPLDPNAPPPGSRVPRLPPVAKRGDRHEPYRVTFVIDLFRSGPEERLALGHKALHRMLRALCEIDCDYLRAYPDAPSIYDGCVRYEVEPPGQEDWQDIPTCLKLGIGDCEDLAAWRAAELIVRHGVPAVPTFIWRKMPKGGTLYHIQVMTPEGIEDPSRMLGMR